MCVDVNHNSRGHGSVTFGKVNVDVFLGWPFHQDVNDVVSWINTPTLIPFESFSIPFHCRLPALKWLLQTGRWIGSIHCFLHFSISSFLQAQPIKVRHETRKALSFLLFLLLVHCFWPFLLTKYPKRLRLHPKQSIKRPVTINCTNTKRRQMIKFEIDEWNGCADLPPLMPRTKVPSQSSEAKMCTIEGQRRGQRINCPK